MNTTHSRGFCRNLILAGFLALAVPSIHAVTVLTDFGGTNATGNWNSISDAIAGSVANAIDNTGASTGIGIAITSRFNGTNANGTTSTTGGAGPYPDFATMDSFFGNADAVFSGIGPIVTATIEITGLSSGFNYNFNFYASRTGVTDNRSTRYTLTGLNSGFGELDASNNITNLIPVNGITPDATGRITLVVGEGTANNNSSGFFYLGAMEINSVPVPEPASAMLFLGSLGAFALRRRRQGGRPA